jgi:hypothetical protein
MTANSPAIHCRAAMPGEMRDDNEPPGDMPDDNEMPGEMPDGNEPPGDNASNHTVHKGKIR